jgi:hypothetical protein
MLELLGIMPNKQHIFRKRWISKGRDSKENIILEPLKEEETN